MSKIAVINKHTAAYDGIEPGRVGIVEEYNPGVRVALQAGHLVATSAPAKLGGGYPSPDEIEAMVHQHQAVSEHAAKLGEELVAKDGVIADLSAQLAQAKENALGDPLVDRLREQLRDAEQLEDTQAATIASLRARVDEIEHALDAATAPPVATAPASAPAGDTTTLDPPAGKPAKK